MNRRELFAGAGAAALSGAVPAVCPGPVTAAEIRDLQEKARLTQMWFDDDALGNTAIWLVSWGTGEVVQVEGEVVNGSLYFRRPGQP